MLFEMRHIRGKYFTCSGAERKNIRKCNWKIALFSGQNVMQGLGNGSALREPRGFLLLKEYEVFKVRVDRSVWYNECLLQHCSQYCVTASAGEGKGIITWNTTGFVQYPFFYFTAGFKNDQSWTRVLWKKFSFTAGARNKKDLYSLS